VVRIEQGYRVCILGIVRGWIDMVEGILRVWLRAVLGEVKGFMMFDFVGRGLEKES
jgi:hypothetical protein